jgi:hypothetical protein
MRPPRRYLAQREGGRRLRPQSGLDACPVNERGTPSLSHARLVPQQLRCPGMRCCLSSLTDLRVHHCCWQELPRGATVAGARSHTCWPAAGAATTEGCHIAVELKGLVALLNGHALGRMHHVLWPHRGSEVSLRDCQWQAAELSLEGWYLKHKPGCGEALSWATPPSNGLFGHLACRSFAEAAANPR